MLLRWKTEEGTYIDRLVAYVGANYTTEEGRRNDRRRNEGGTTEGKISHIYIYRPIHITVLIVHSIIVAH